jgi:hypothetical protein
MVHRSFCEGGSASSLRNLIDYFSGVGPMGFDEEVNEFAAVKPRGFTDRKQTFSPMGNY